MPPKKRSHRKGYHSKLDNILPADIIQIPNYDLAKDKGKPTEEWLLLEIVKLLPGENLRQDIAEYMADCGYLDRLPANSVPDLVNRQVNASLRELIDVFGGIAEECRKIDRKRLAIK